MESATALTFSEKRHERWSSVRGHPEYEVSDRGRIRRAEDGHGTFAGRLLCPDWAGSGRRYRVATLYRDGVRHRRMLHHLVLEAFGAPRPTPDHECNHIDLDPANNRIENLEWVTSSENSRHALRNGRCARNQPKGEAHPSAKITRPIVREIRHRASAGESYMTIASVYGISSTQVGCIVRRENWRHV